MALVVTASRRINLLGTTCQPSRRRRIHDSTAFGDNNKHNTGSPVIYQQALPFADVPLYSVADLPDEDNVDSLAAFDGERSCGSNAL